MIIINKKLIGKIFVNIYLSSYCSEITTYSDKNILSFLSTQNKKILVIVTIAFSCLAACYAIYHYFWKKKVINLVNENVEGKKTASLDTLKAFFPPITNPEPVFGELKPGLNLEGRCKNANCEAYNQLRILPKGLKDHFDISKECSYSSCPCCQSEIHFDDINNMILDSCQFEIEAMNIKNQKIQGIFQALPPQNLRLDMRECYYIELKNLAKIS